jgi:hypothetical protein
MERFPILATVVALIFLLLVPAGAALTSGASAHRSRIREMTSHHQKTTARRKTPPPRRSSCDHPRHRGS